MRADEVDNLTAYLAQFEQILSASSEGLNREWSFKLDCKALIAVNICLDVAGQNMPVILTDCKPTYWNCVWAGHVTSSYADLNFLLSKSVISVPPVIVMPATWTGAV